MSRFQVWYNNIQFREYILGVKFEKIKIKEENSSPNSEESESMPVLKFESSECLGANLQMMFTLMKESVRKSIDPNFFIRAIGLDENMQQVSDLDLDLLAPPIFLTNLFAHQPTRTRKSSASSSSPPFRAA